MKKIVIILTIILFASLATKSYGQKNRTLSNGFSINLIGGFPPSTYGLTSDSNLDDKYKFGFIGGLQIGNRWYFSPKEKFGFGLIVNWVDISGAFKSTADEFGQLDRTAVDFSVCEIGPIGTLALTDNIALDLYYNLRPTVFATYYVFSSNSLEDDDVGYGGIGLSHAFGTAFRWKVLNLGLEYVLGSIKCSDFETESGNPDEQLKVNNFRIKVGVKF
jgi:hypothetical protein